MTPTKVSYTEIIDLLLIAVIALVYGILLLSYYLWYKAGWRKKLTSAQAIVFWVSVSTLTIAQIFIVVGVARHFDFLS